MNNKKESSWWRVVIIGIGFAVGLALLVFGSWEDKKEPESTPDAEEYRRAVQTELEELCSACTEGEVKVFVTLGEGYSYSYAADSRGGVATIGSGSSESALVTHTKMPVISGVGVVCNDSDPSCKARLSELIQSALGIGSNKIFIVEGKNP